MLTPASLNTVELSANNILVGLESDWRVDAILRSAFHIVMARTILSIADARRATRDPAVHVVWVAQEHAEAFREEGWVRLEPPRDGGVMFLNRVRQEAARHSGREAQDGIKA